MADFAVELLKLTPVEACMVMSPLSVVAALSVLERGAGGATKSQISDALKRTSNDDVPELIRQLASADGVLMNVATRFYLADSTNLHEDYNNQISKDFDVIAERLNFRDQRLTVQTINSFVSDATHGMIKQLLSDNFSAADMKAFLVNAVYFKGQWAKKFSEDSTRKDVFHGIKGDREESFMNMNNVKTCRYSQGDGVQVLALEYKDKNYEFVIFLPSQDVPFAQFRESITGEKIQELLGQASSGGVDVTIPKFKLSSSPNLKSMLQSLGVTDLFNSHDCDLHGVSPDELYVADAIHQAVIEVDEKGREPDPVAEAVAKRMFTLRNIHPLFRADHPFLYGVFRDHKPIFIGQYC
ncbi:hypothetical protein V3C99_016373 [Haemonchus contortus]